LPADELEGDGCAGALIDPDGGAYLPWGPYLSASDVRRMRADLAVLIEDLATLEGWPREHLDDVIGRAMRGPLHDLMPNLAHFHERTAAARAEHEASEAVKARSWRLEGFDNRKES
jgi:hypothetical protein